MKLFCAWVSYSGGDIYVSSGGHFVQQSRTICAVKVVGIHFEDLSLHKLKIVDGT